MTQPNENEGVSPSQEFDSAAAKAKGVTPSEKQAELERRIADRRRHLLDGMPSYKQYNGPPAPRSDAEKQAEFEHRRRHLLDGIPGYKQYNGP